MNDNFCDRQHSSVRLNAFNLKQKQYQTSSNLNGMLKNIELLSTSENSEDPYGVA